MQIAASTSKPSESFTPTSNQSMVFALSVMGDYAMDINEEEQEWYTGS